MPVFPGFPSYSFPSAPSPRTSLPCPGGARCCPVPRSSSSPPRVVPPPPGKRKRGGRKPSRPRRAGPGPHRDRDGATMASSIGNFLRRSLRRAGRRGEGREGLREVPASVSVSVSGQVQAAGADGCRWSGDVPGCSRRQRQRLGPSSSARSHPTPRSPARAGCPETHHNFNPPFSGVQPIPRAAPHLPGAHPFPSEPTTAPGAAPQIPYLPTSPLNKASQDMAARGIWGTRGVSMAGTHEGDAAPQERWVLQSPQKAVQKLVLWDL